MGGIPRALLAADHARGAAIRNRPGAVTDCFVHVCGELSNNAFRRLLRFRPDGTARFQTWLSAVVSNLCVDWRRQQHGRYRPIQSVARLPELDQLVYRYIYVRGMPREECLHVLRSRFPDLTEQRLSEVNGAAVRVADAPPALAAEYSGGRAVATRRPALSGQGHGGCISARRAGSRARRAFADRPGALQLEAAMARLLPQQRLLLRLRYQQNLTLEEIARLTGCPTRFAPTGRSRRRSRRSRRS